MKVLVIYDSVYGNTEIIANAIGEKFNSFHETEVIKAPNLDFKDMEGVGLLIIGSPTHGGWYTEPIKKIIESMPREALVDIKVATFDTSFPTTNMGFIMNHLAKFFGNAATRLKKKFVKKGTTVIDSKIFYVVGKEGPLQDGEIEKAQMWVDQLQKLL